MIMISPTVVLIIVALRILTSDEYLHWFLARG